MCKNRKIFSLINLKLLTVSLLTLSALYFAASASSAVQSPLADIGPAPAVVLTDAAGKPFDLARLGARRCW